MKQEGMTPAKFMGDASERTSDLFFEFNNSEMVFALRVMRITRAIHAEEYGNSRPVSTVAFATIICTWNLQLTKCLSTEIFSTGVPYMCYDEDISDTETKPLTLLYRRMFDWNMQHLLPFWIPVYALCSENQINNKLHAFADSMLG